MVALSVILAFSFAACAALLAFNMLAGIGETMEINKAGLPRVFGSVGFIASLMITFSINTEVQAFAMQNSSQVLIFLLVFLVGVINKNSRLTAFASFFMELVCALLIANSGTRIATLPFVGALPVAAQYVVTVLLICSVSYLYKLSMRVENGSGSFAIANMLLLSLVFLVLNKLGFASLLAAVAGGLVARKQFNKANAMHKMDLGESGSLLLGFLTAISCVHLFEFSPSQILIPGNAGLYVNVFVICFITVLLIMAVRRNRLKEIPVHHTSRHLDKTVHNI